VLLIEATITVAVIAVFLVLLTRSFGSSLRALRQTQEYQLALRLAEQKLAELELDAELGTLPSAPATTTSAFPEPWSRFEWSMIRTRFQAPNMLLNGNPPAVDRLSLTVADTHSTSGARVNLTTLVLHTTGS